MADSAPAITKGFTLGFGYRPRWRINCWTYALKKSDNKYSCFIPATVTKLKRRREYLFFYRYQNQSMFFNSLTACKLLLERYAKNSS